MLESSDVRLLTELGFIAAGRGWLEQARGIFEPMIRLRPLRAFPYVGLAMAYLNRGEAVRACEVLESGERAMSDADADALDIQDEYATLLSYYGLALQTARRTEHSLRVLNSLVHRPADDAAGRLARSLLGMPQPA